MVGYAIAKPPYIRWRFTLNWYQMGWLIDPDEQTVFVYRSKQELEVFDQADDLLPAPPFASELQLTVKDLFAWLLE